MSILLLHMPPTLHLMISSRADPPLPLARLRVQGQLCELRVADLRFTRQEISSFFQQREVTAFNDNQMAILEERTEGWAAGLQLAALSVSGRDAQGVEQFVAAFHGDHQYVFDYLMEEVLARQPADVRLFLLQSSILNRLIAPLCDALTARAGSQAILEELERMNLFLIPLDDHRHWYRYHTLFADFLRQQLEREIGANGIQRLHQRAGAWYKLEGFNHDTVYHFLTAEDFEAAAWLIEESRLDLLMRGEWQRLSTWLNRFPTAFRRSRLGLILADTWCWLFDANFETVAEQIEQIEAMIEPPSAFASASDSSDAAALAGELAAIRSKLYLWQNEHQKATETAQQALTYLVNGNQFRFFINECGSPFHTH